ncbi:MAG: aldose 1-epimerase, partial [Flavobacteriaceae bacterium]|nr:aldose 1-epimerase [Flavobacteriaceae bacterium]
MEKSTILISIDRNSILKIDEGELVSYIKDGEELIHQKGSPGWNKSDIEMFPIIGPTSTNNNKVYTKKGECIQGQHGFLRELEYYLVNNSKTKAVLKKTYKANAQINNSGFPENSNEPYTFWSYNFTFTKSFELFDDFLLIQFELKSEKGMPFMFGYHPAFKLSGDLDETIQIKNKKITIKDVIK